MSQIEEQLNNKFEEILKEIRTNRNYNITTDDEDAERSQPGPSNSKNRSLRNKHSSNTTIDRDKNQDDRFYPSEMSELRKPYTPLGIANETLDETIVINENRRENTDHHKSKVLRKVINPVKMSVTTGLPGWISPTIQGLVHLFALLILFLLLLFGLFLFLLLIGFRAEVFVQITHQRKLNQSPEHVDETQTEVHV